MNRRGTVRAGAAFACLAASAFAGRAGAAQNAPAIPTASAAGAGGAAADAADTAPAFPFSVGEHLTYDVKFGIVHVGSGTLEVAGVEPLRGRDAFHTVFRIKGGTIFYHVNDTLESWFDTRTMASLRFAQHLDEGGKVRERDYEIYPDRANFVLNRKPPQPSVPDPLDDGSFLYFVRTLPLNVGDTYTFNKYFNPKANPVTIRVLRRERIQVPAGTFNAVVVQPIIKTSGIFSEHGEAQVWFSDDSSHIVLQMKSKLSFGSLDLYLRDYQPGRGPAANRVAEAAGDTGARAAHAAHGAGSARAGGGAGIEGDSTPTAARPSGAPPPSTSPR